MSDLAPAASPHVLTAAASARRGECRWWVVARTAFPFVVVALAWELTAQLGIFPRKLFPPLEEVAAALVRLTAEGVLPHHVLDTLARLLAGFALAAVAGVAIGFAMGRFKDIWVRSAQAMGADNRRLLHHVILPGALPYVLTGLRLGLAQAWRILVGVEMLAAVSWGLGWMIFGAREFLNTDVMLAGVAVIGAIGLALEKLVFQRLEQYTVVRWGMMS